MSIKKLDKQTVKCTAGVSTYHATWERSIFGTSTKIDIVDMATDNPVARVEYIHRTDEGMYKIAFCDSEGNAVYSEWQVMPVDLIRPLNINKTIQWICSAHDSQCFVDLCPVEGGSYV